MTDAAPRLAAVAETLLKAPLPVRIRAWDGSEAGPPGTPTLVVHDRRALRRMLWKPGEMGLARAWVAGELTVEGDLFDLLDRVAGLLWERRPEPPPEEEPARAAPGRVRAVGLRAAAVRSGGPRAALPALPERFARVAAAAAPLRDPYARAAVRELALLARPWPAPPPPPEEAARRGGPSHTRSRDKQAIGHHYDVGNEFYERVLGPSMVYSCAYWSPGGTLEEAQYDKLDLVCRKLALRPGGRLLDVGCGWGSMALHAAREYGVRVTGVTLSREQAAYARKRVADEGLADLVEIRIQDYRDVRDGPYDAISSIGMAEHVGAERYRVYARTLYDLLRPGGRLLNHQIGRPPEAVESAHRIDEFIDAYVFPDGELSPLGTTVGELERAGFEVRDVEALREHYALTLRAWVTRLEEHWTQAVRLTSPGRARVWLLYMAASALGFEHGRLGVNQVLAVKPGPGGAAGLPLRLRTWDA
ncbi:SAM-dependent methyltransferase [Streptomyces subrutilus]|uniref:Class I SAM-dependent methyltransferase n=1 Tax=Streptomyces subrutilus TaxID=36818 RepID=A0A5P2ULT8_9ACTN|nr:cyclopropane-fatty-acyl-phospholipid synthase family protein [Streptomyces subrutilus]QEU80296.1 class I SAM-dependent methyltransferase [Streptomyces subrutilus]WSJ30417.1 cyclopropane-fatty-acyl-phospholipid synthase family protein [Streptomyces subrutilus]GGZ48872.1 cyclopropane-fatty-acyl-phospholipid synthase [Streptomyces subrutilus]